MSCSRESAGTRRAPCLTRLQRLNSTILSSHAFDLGELWIKSGFRCVM